MSVAGDIESFIHSLPRSCHFGSRLICGKVNTCHLPLQRISLRICVKARACHCKGFPCNSDSSESLPDAHTFPDIQCVEYTPSSSPPAAASQSRPVFNGTMDEIIFSNTYKEHWNNAMPGESPIPLSQDGSVLMMARREGNGCRVLKGMVTAYNDFFGNQCRNQSKFNVMEINVNRERSRIYMPNGVPIVMPNGEPIVLVSVPIHLVQRRTNRQQYFAMGVPPGDPDTDRFSPSPSPPRDRLAIENQCAHETNAPAMEEPRVTREAKTSATKQSAVHHVNALKYTVLGEKRHRKRKESKDERKESEDETHVRKKKS